MQQSQAPVAESLIDIGVNLTHDSYDDDRDAVIARAEAAGVAHMIVTGTDVEASRRASALVRQRPAYFSSTAGVHPHHASDWTAQTPLALRELAAQPGVVAIGECGLDFFRNFSPPAAQEAAFIAQLGLAAELGLPVFLHQRDAFGRFAAILREHLPGLRGAVAHCFTGTRAEAETLVDMGLSLGITGWLCDERRGSELRAAVPHIPADRLLIETDAPYLLPRDLRPRPKSRRNEPMHLPHILAVLAGCRNESPVELGPVTTANARRLFGLGFPAADGSSGTG